MLMRHETTNGGRGWKVDECNTRVWQTHYESGKTGERIPIYEVVKENSDSVQPARDVRVEKGLGVNYNRRKHIQECDVKSERSNE